MNEKWTQLAFDTRRQLLKDMTAKDIKVTYGLSDAEFDQAIASFSKLPQLEPKAKLHSVSAAPDKRSLREASRDFDPTLIFAELVDNSIDRFTKSSLGANAALRVTIFFDPVLNSCTYEDNAGGFQSAQLVNFFRPGGTDNTPLTQSIGSYAWGAKKARAALADSVDLISRVPAAKAFLATISSDWDERDNDWMIQVGEEGKDFTLNAKALIKEGHTRLFFKNLKPLIKVDSSALAALRRNLGEIYALMLAHHPFAPHKFNLDLEVQGQPVTGEYQYRWTAVHDAVMDLRPRRYNFHTSVLLPFVPQENAKKQELHFVLEIGVKQDTGCATPHLDRSDLFDVTDDWGIDVYGNGRLVQRNVRAGLGLTEDLIQNQQGAKLVKGRLLITGSSYAIPWDTHKSRIAESHPSLGAINSQIGHIVQAFIKSLKKAARTQQAISKFQAIPWNHKWEYGESGKKKESLEFSHSVTVPTNAKAHAPEHEHLGEGQSALVKQDVASAKTEILDTIAANGSTIPAMTDMPANYLPVFASSRSGAVGNKTRTVKFHVSEREYQGLCTWLKCESKELNDKIKRRVLRDAKIRVPRPGGALNTKKFQKLRTLIGDPAILAALQVSGLSSPAAVRKAGKTGLKRAKLSPEQIELVFKAVVSAK